MKKIKNSIIAILWIIAALVIVLFFNALSIYNNPDSFAKKQGKAIGIALGSIDAPKKWQEGFEEGKKAGLSAEDTTVNIISNSFGTGELEVLRAEVNLNNYHSIGKDNDYFKIGATTATAIWTIDLGKIKIEENNDVVTIIVPTPEYETVGIKEEEVLFQVQKDFFNGSSVDGAEAYVNSQNKIQEEIDEEISKNDTMKKIATESAKKRMQSLTEKLSMKKINYEIKCESEINTEAREGSINE